MDGWMVGWMDGWMDPVVKYVKPPVIDWGFYALCGLPFRFEQYLAFRGTRIRNALKLRNELNFSDVYRSVHYMYIGSLAKFT